MGRLRYPSYFVMHLRQFAEKYPLTATLVTSLVLRVLPHSTH